ncbi:hypothetical protein DOTSEDRAFT_69206 [Dothistroma septosporum NZE10]|uniref:Uncharacterized protein n=1 Tax=Dothistroma septosporum (strain NZE10 / CBS 128990) TaxID=675120 RepID=N1PXP7_DOTSN|nr:hypothetical protein DOTSEDRAFT_69206 [Dothistroma septosporum NZE10]
MDLCTSIGLWGPGSAFSYTDNVNTWQASLMENADDFHASKDCVPVWKDPMDGITATLNELMFRTSVQAARTLLQDVLSFRLDQDLPTEYQVDGLRIDTTPVFRTRWPFFWAATSIQVVCVVLVLITCRYLLAACDLNRAWVQCDCGEPFGGATRSCTNTLAAIDVRDSCVGI